MAAITLASLALTACGDSGNQLVQVPPPRPDDATAALQGLERAAQALTDRCLDVDLAPDEPTPPAVDAAVEELLRTFYLVEDRNEAEDELRDARLLLEAGCASPATVERFTAATGVGSADLVDLPEPEDCDAQGINAAEGEEGTCRVDGGPRVTVVNPGNTATTPEMAVTLLDARADERATPGSQPGAPPQVATVQLTLEVRNLTDAQAVFDPATQVKLVLDKRTYSTREEPTSEIDPDDQALANVSFEVPAQAAEELDTSGNVYVFGFGDAGLDFLEAEGTVVVLRTYE